MPDRHNLKAYTQIDTVKPIISVLGPATFSFRDGDTSFETMCRIADAVWTENDASRDGITDCCEIRKSLGLTGAGEPCLI